jgi:hypothetical protein
MRNRILQRLVRGEKVYMDSANGHGESVNGDFGEYECFIFDDIPLPSECGEIIIGSETIPPYSKMWCERHEDRKSCAFTLNEINPKRAVVPEGQPFSRNLRWFSVSIFISTHHYHGAWSRVVEILPILLLGWDEKGKLKKFCWNAWNAYEPPRWPRKARKDLITSLVVTALMPFLEYFHCKNIVECEERPLKRKTRKEKVLKKSAIKFKTLAYSNTLVKRNNGPYSISNDSIVPLHKCRGHFKTYTEDAPLFGKYSGRFFVQAHARGKKSNGEILKDYEAVRTDLTQELIARKVMKNATKTADYNPLKGP